MKALLLLSTALLCSMPALASVTVTAPVNGASVTSPFTLTASASPCSSQAIASMGYSLDNGTTTIVKGSSLSASVAASVGSHVLHVKSWGPNGAACWTDVSITVKSSTTTGLTVTSPVSGSTVSSPFSLIASGSVCSGEAIKSMGYSLDGGGTTTVSGTSLNKSVTASAGSHTVHVKSWTASGAGCHTDVPITVSSTTTNNLTVSSPQNGSTVYSPFSLVASGTLCSGQAITKIGYSLDGGGTTTVSGTSLNKSVSAATGSHTVHVKSWGSSAYCTEDVAISVKKAPAGPAIPSYALATTLIQNYTKWTAMHDAGTTGNSSGKMSLVANPSTSGSARKFATTYTNYGGERYNIDVKPDATATNFVYDTQIYLASPSNEIANIELDLNQVIGGGNVVIYGFQCDVWSHTWDYARNSGTISSPKAHWLHTTQSCDPHKWTTDTWHHVQIQYSRDNSGNVTYKSVWFDGVEQPINVTVMSEFGLGWGPSLNMNVQIDGFVSTSGSSTVYLDNMTLYSW